MQEDLEKIEIRAYYDTTSLKGAISASRVEGKRPVLFKIQGFSIEKNGAVAFKNVEYRSVREAVDAATQYGFLPHRWRIETL